MNGMDGWKDGRMETNHKDKPQEFKNQIKK